MINLKNIADAWGTDNVDATLKNTLENMSVKELPLQKGLSSSNIALDNNIKAVILHKDTHATVINIKVGLFYTGVIAGCSCADDPGPVDEQTEYCEVMLSINKQTGDTKINLLTG